MKNKGKQERSKATIQTIVSAAAQVLIEHGYEKSTTNRIAERAGYSVGTLYQYFDDKADIYGKLIDQTLAELLWAASSCPVQATLAETLQHLLSRILQGLEHDPALIQALEALLVGQFREKRSIASESIVASITQLLAAHRDEIVVEDLELAARIIVGATEGLSNSGNFSAMSPDQLETQLLRVQLAYLTMKTRRI